MVTKKQTSKAPRTKPSVPALQQPEKPSFQFANYRTLCEVRVITPKYQESVSLRFVGVAPHHFTQQKFTLEQAVELTELGWMVVWPVYGASRKSPRYGQEAYEWATKLFQRMLMETNNKIPVEEDKVKALLAKIGASTK